MSDTKERARKPEVFHPADFLREEMACRGWSAATVGEKSGLGQPNIETLLAKKRGVNLFIAHGLAVAFDTSRELWLNLQKQFDIANGPPGPKNQPKPAKWDERG